MSDDEDFMMEDEDFEFDYEDEEGEEADVDLENKYYNTKGKKDDEPHEALEDFQSILLLDTEHSEWGFKALKQMFKLNYKLSQFEKAFEYYRQLLQYTSHLTKNYTEKSINNLMDLIAGSTDLKFLEQVYSETLTTLENSKNDRLWTKANLKLAKLWLDRAEYVKLKKTLSSLYSACHDTDGIEDQRKGTLLLEIYALEIQMYTDLKNTKRLKELYQKCLNVKTAIAHPKIMAIIRECGGKMHMAQKEWAKAQTDFFEAFKSYDEAGSTHRIQCLKYLVLANMLMKSQINPFDSQETKPYKSSPEIVAMTSLVDAYQKMDLHGFQKILNQNPEITSQDSFLEFYMADVLQSIRSQYLLKLVSPFTRLRMDFISSNLNTTMAEVESLLVELITEEKLAGKIDQTNNVLYISRLEKSQIDAHYDWIKAIRNIWDSHLQKM